MMTLQLQSVAGIIVATSPAGGVAIRMHSAAGVGIDGMLGFPTPGPANPHN